MASPNTNYSEVVTTTLQRYTKTLADNVTKHNALLRRLKQKGQISATSGGRTLVRELEYAENATFSYYSGYETLNISPSDVFSAAEFDWKQCAVSVIASGLELRRNSGKEQLIRLLDSRIRNAEKTMMNNVSTGIYSDGTGSGGKQIGGLQLLIADDPTSGTVGGINRANFSFWRNKTYDFSDNTATASATSIITAMRTLWQSCVRGTDQPDTIIADDTYWGYYWDALQAQQRFAGTDNRDAGPMSLKFFGADVFFDTGGGCPANHMYFLNTDYLFFEAHPQANFTPLDEREPVNQDAIVRPLIWMGNLTMSNASLQGVIKA